MEIKYPYFLGGEMLDGYQDNDQVMAQASVDAACHSATIIERERIIKLLTDRSEDGESWLDLFEGCGCCSKLTEQELIALIKGEK